MASAIIHISVANEINKKLKMNNDLLLIGSIAPDLAKLIGQTKDKGHFLFGDKGTPHMDKFLLKYRIDNPFNMGYYIHLYTDLYWFRDLLPKIPLELFFPPQPVILNIKSTPSKIVNIVFFMLFSYFSM